MTFLEGLQLITVIVTMAGGILSLSVGISKYKKVFIKLSGHFLIWTGVLIVLGYVVNAAQLYTIPPHTTPTSFPSAVCFIVIGANLIGIANRSASKKGTDL